MLLAFAGGVALAGSLVVTKDCNENPNPECHGTDRSDVILGSSGKDVIYAMKGGDTVISNQGGEDTVHGGNGSDLINVQDGDLIAQGEPAPTSPDVVDCGDNPRGKPDTVIADPDDKLIDCEVINPIPK